jgi:hypothetical protein
LGELYSFELFTLKLKVAGRVFFFTLITITMTNLPCEDCCQPINICDCEVVKLAQLVTWLSCTRIRGNLDQLIMSYITEQQMPQVLERVRTYVGDYVFNGVTAQREIAALVVEKQGYPL